MGDLGQDLGDLRSGSGPDPRESGLIFLEILDFFWKKKAQKKSNM